jgi:hypothetical protein
MMRQYMRTDRRTFGPIFPTLHHFLLFCMARHALHYHYACLVHHTTIYGQSRRSPVYAARNFVTFEYDTALFSNLWSKWGYICWYCLVALTENKFIDAPWFFVEYRKLTQVEWYFDITLLMILQRIVTGISLALLKVLFISKIAKNFRTTFFMFVSVKTIAKY